MNPTPKTNMIDVKSLSKICDLPIASFKDYGKQVETIDGLYFFNNKNAKILGVAHLDTVQNPTPLTCEKGIVSHPCLDDRLGVYVLLDVLPTLGIEFDLLLTEGEESGKSTAAHFKPDKKYNWMFSFDRAGTDVVMYQYQDSLIERMVEHHGIKVGLGSFSDISFMSHVGCKGFNFGVGYHNNHSPNAYAILSETTEMINKFAAFYNACKDTELPHTKDRSMFRDLWD
jgi:hypothetical protein